MLKFHTSTPLSLTPLSHPLSLFHTQPCSHNLLSTIIQKGLSFKVVKSRDTQDIYYLHRTTVAISFFPVCLGRQGMDEVLCLYLGHVAGLVS